MRLEGLSSVEHTLCHFKDISFIEHDSRKYSDLDIGPPDSLISIDISEKIKKEAKSSFLLRHAILLNDCEISTLHRLCHRLQL